MMPRLAAFLTLIAALGLPLSVTGQREYREYQSALSFAFGQAAWKEIRLGLLPHLLLLSALVFRPPFARVLQAAGSVGVLILCAWLVVSLPQSLYAAGILSSTLGLALLSLLESTLFSRPPPSPDPARRFTLGLLLILVFHSLLAVHWIWTNRWVSSSGDHLHFLSMVGGQAAAFFVVAWGLWAKQRWSPWVGALLAGALAVETLGSYPYWLLRDVDFTFRTLPRLLVLITVAVLLGTRAWKERRQSPAA